MVYSFNKLKQTKQLTNQKKKQKKQTNCILAKKQTKIETQKQKTQTENKVYTENNAEKLPQGPIFNFASQTTYLNKFHSNTN